MRSGEHPTGSGLGQCSSPRESAGFDGQDLQVVIQRQDFDIASDSALVAGDQGGPVVDLDGAGRQPNREPPAGVAGGNGVEALPHRHSGTVVDPGLQEPGRVERLVR